MSKEVFICYETTTGLDYAKHLKGALENKNKSNINKSAFVAYEDVEVGKPPREAIDEAIESCKYFVVIVTVLAIEAEDVKREIKIADNLPHLKGNIITCREKSVDRLRLSELPIITGLQQIDFESKEELVRKVIKIFERKTKNTHESVPPEIYRLIDRLTGN
jgi:hypothetical protein